MINRSRGKVKKGRRGEKKMIFLFQLHKSRASPYSAYSDSGSIVQLWMTDGEHLECDVTRGIESIIIPEVIE